MERAIDMTWLREVECGQRLGEAVELSDKDMHADDPTPQITTIFRGTSKPKGLFGAAVEEKRVAAYCRVSTFMETQTLSLETQMEVFRRRIMEHPGWTLVNVYSDQGITGTSAAKRKAFMQMIADCEAGRIDYIITKSISRFARNTLECIQYVRYLKSIGVYVLFEKENLDTGKEQSEMILTILASFAQEESHSISENVKWGIRKGLQKGKARWCNCFGFVKGENGKPVVNPDEAQIVKRMFWQYEHGATLPEIATALNNQGIPSPRGKQWVSFNVSEVLSNEKYTGDALLQKYISIDHLSHKRVKNDATEVSSYYVKNHHRGIISPKTFERVQKIRALRNNFEGHIPQYPYGETDIRCPLCGKPLVQRNTRGNYRNRLALGCFTEEGCGRFALRKNMLNAALLEAYNSVKVDALATGTVEAETAKSFLIMKKEQPKMETVEFYWLDELVEQIEIVEHTGEKDWKTRSPVSCWDAIVHWRCGLESIVPMNLRYVGNEPSVVAEQYWVNEAKYRESKVAFKVASEGEEP